MPSFRRERNCALIINLAEGSFSKNRTNGVPRTNYLDNRAVLIRVVIVRLNLNKAKFMSIGITLFPFLYSSTRKEQAGVQQTTDLTLNVFLRPFLL
jgi:hypothetical protein